jgi:phospholipid/cholesterol/gamma-HCH transport system substrate-binding protein
MRNSLETRLGMFFALSVIAAFLLLELGGGVRWFRSGRTVRAAFRNVQDLKVGDPVRLGGVSIGSVSRVALTGDQVEVSLRIENAAQVRTDSAATIRFTGMMGQNYVSLDFGTPTAPLAADNTLLVAKEQPDLATLMEKLNGVAEGVQTMTRSFSGEEFSKLLGPLTELVKDNQPRISAILANVQTVSAQVASGNGTVGKLIQDETLYRQALALSTNANELAGEARVALTDSRAAIGDARTILASVQKGEGSVGRLLKDDTLATELTAASTNLRQILEKINQGQGSVGKLVNDESFLKNIKMTLQKVDKATEGLEDTGPLNVLGTLIQSVF